MEKTSFLKQYQSHIMPKINELDLLMKNGDFEIEITFLSDILSTNTYEIKQILNKLGEPYPTKENIFDIIANSKSEICRLIMRECECGSPKLYTAFQIAYIYNLSTYDVSKVFDLLKIEKASSEDLFRIFANIYRDADID